MLVQSAGWLGTINQGQTIDFFFFTNNSSGTPTQLAGSPTLAVYKANNTTETTTGPTLTVDFDSRTGMNHVRVATSDAFYASGNDFHIVLTAGTVGGTSVVGAVVGSFSIGNRVTNALVNLDDTLSSVKTAAQGAQAEAQVATSTAQGAVDRLPPTTDGFLRAVKSITLGTVAAGSSTSVIETGSSLVPACSVQDQFRGQIVCFDKNTATAALRGQKTDILANTAGGQLAVTPLTTQPSAGDLFSIQ